MTLNVSNTYAPNKPTITLSGQTSFGGNSIIIANHTSLKCTSSVTTGKLGATISSYVWSFPDGTKGENKSSVTKTFSSSYSSKNITLTITDSRGYSSTSDPMPITVYAYSPPEITLLMVERANPSGVVDSAKGTYPKITYTISYTSSINGTTNTLTLYPAVDGTSVTFKNQSIGLLNTTVPLDKSLTVGLRVRDSLENYFPSSDSYYPANLSSASYLLHFAKNKNAVGIGCAAVAPSTGQTGKITIGWPISFKSTMTFGDNDATALGISCGGTGVNSEDGFKKLIGNLMYPVGSIYMSTSSTNPSSLFGGTWVAWGAGRVPVGIKTSDSNFNSVEKTGGEATHKLTINEMPSHNHVQQVWNRLAYDSGSTRSAAYWEEANDLKNLPAMSYTGGSAAHNNLQPYITCYMWKRTA